MKFSRQRSPAEFRPRKTGELLAQPQESGVSSEFFDLQKDLTGQDWKDAEKSAATMPTIDWEQYWLTVGNWKKYVANARIVTMLAREAHRTVQLPEQLFENILGIIEEKNKRENFTEDVHTYENFLIFISSTLALFPERREELLQHPVVKAMAPLCRINSNRAVVESTCVFPERKQLYDDEGFKRMEVSGFETIISRIMYQNIRRRMFVGIQAAADLAVLFPELPKTEYLNPEFFSDALEQFRRREEGDTGPGHLSTDGGIEARCRAALNLHILSAERAEIGDDGQIHITPRQPTLRKGTPLPPRPPHV